MIHDLVLALSFLTMIIAPAFVAMRAEGGQPESETPARERGNIFAAGNRI